MRNLCVPRRLLRSMCSLAICLSMAVAENPTLPAKPAGSPGIELFVSPLGQDGNPGSREKPLASLAGARARVRVLRQERAPSPVTVTFAEGIYSMAAPALFTSADSGSPEAPITYRAERPGKAILEGGRRITGWKAEGKGLWAVALPEVTSGKWDFYQLFVNGRRATRARFPNEGTFRSFGPTQPVMSAALEGPQKDPRFTTEFLFRGEDLKPWAGLEEAMLVYYHSWLVSLHWIKQVDAATRTVFLRNPTAQSFGKFENKAERYFIENVREALDAPGEWFLEKSKGILRYLPLPGEDMGTAEVFAPVALRLLEFSADPRRGERIAHLAFEGFILRHVDWRVDRDTFRDNQAFPQVDSAVVFATGLCESRFENLELSHAGMQGMVFWDGCQRNRVLRCRFEDLAGGGIYLGKGQAFNTNSSPAIRNGGHVIDNCLLYDLGRVLPGVVGIFVGQSSSNRIAHCDVSEMSYTGISVGWQWGRETQSDYRGNLVEGNRVHHIMQGILSDGGGIYTTGYLSDDTVIRGNVVHDVDHLEVNGKGIYLDGCSSGITVSNNLCYDIEGLGIQVKGERNAIRNNLFVRCGEASASRAFQGDEAKKYRFAANVFERNILVQRGGVHSAAPKTLREDLFIQECGNTPEQWVSDSNLFWRLAPSPRPGFYSDPAGMKAALDYTLAEWQETGRDRASRLADPMFSDVARRAFRLRPDSPAKNIDFIPFPHGQAGLYGPPEWVALPSTLKHRPAKRHGPSWLDVRFDFEDHLPGMMPVTCWQVAEKGAANIRVTEARAASGRRAMVFQDAAEGPGYLPVLALNRNPFGPGVYRLGFTLCLDPDSPAELELQTRDGYAKGFLRGATMKISPAGALSWNEKPLATLPPGTWVRLELEFGSGKPFAGTCALSITPRGGQAQRFEKLPAADGGLDMVSWVGLYAPSAGTGRLYIDDLEIRRLEKNDVPAK